MNSEPYSRDGGELIADNRLQLELMRGVLARGAAFRFQALGFSMSPFIRHGDMLTVTPLDALGRSLGVGDIVACVPPGTDQLLVHRVLGETGNTVLVRGDNSFKEDGRLPREAVLGVVTGVERDGRAVWFGLGPGRRLIATLNARNWLLPLRRLVHWPFRPLGAVLRRLQGAPAVRKRLTLFRPRAAIEEATARDLIAVQAYLTPGEDLVPSPHKPGVTHYVAKSGTRVLGYVQLVRRPPERDRYGEYWLYGLVVFSTRYRGMGLGEELTRRVIEQATSEGSAKLFLNVFADNHPAVRLYTKLGFVRVNVLAIQERSQSDAWPDHRRTLSMCKNLTSVTEPQ